MTHLNSATNLWRMDCWGIKRWQQFAWHLPRNVWHVSHNNVCVKLPAQQRSKSSLRLMKQTGTHQKIEANMFARLYRGYAVNNPSVLLWRTNVFICSPTAEALHPYSEPLQSYHTLITMSDNFDNKSLEPQLISRYTLRLSLFGR